MVLTDNQELADRCWSVHNCGRVREGAWYQHEVLGGNFRMTQWQAGILLAQMRNFEEQARVREENGRYLSERLAEIGGFEPQQRGPKVTQHGYHLFISRYDRRAFHDVPREAIPVRTAGGRDSLCAGLQTAVPHERDQGWDCAAEALCRC